MLMVSQYMTTTSGPEMALEFEHFPFPRCLGSPGFNGLAWQKKIFAWSITHLDSKELKQKKIRKAETWIGEKW